MMNFVLLPPLLGANIVALLGLALLTAFRGKPPVSIFLWGSRLCVFQLPFALGILLPPLAGVSERGEGLYANY